VSEIFAAGKKQIIMAEHLQFNLVEGNFAPEEAATVVLSLINNKINFHELDVFRQHERGETDSNRSLRRISELTESRKHVLGLLERAKNEGLKISVNGMIEIAAS
jgi:hypothetical protein